jgi:dihydroorotase
MIKALKYYPAGATTNSDQGVTDISKTYSTLEAMMEKGLPLLVHGEVTDNDVDVFDRESVFIDRVLAPLVRNFPDLKIVFEHITTRAAVDFVTQSSNNIAATITPQHMLLNRNDLFKGGLQPHHYCLPVLKAEADRLAVLEAATSGNSKFFLGTDSAPHARNTKETSCGCAGIYSAYAAIEMYVEAFDAADKLDKLEAFSSHYGADYYGLPRNQEMITLIKQDQTIPAILPLGDNELVPFLAGGTCSWQLKN